MQQREAGHAGGNGTRAREGARGRAGATEDDVDDELAQARPLLLKRLAKADILIDDFGSHVLGAAERRHLIEVLEDRYGISSTILTTQLEPDQWHAIIGDAKVARAA